MSALQTLERLEGLAWKDATTFSQGEKDRTPRVWKLAVGSLRLSVYRHRHYEPDVWLMSCEPFCNDRQLANTDATAAKAEAAMYVAAALREALQSLEKP